MWYKREENGNKKVRLNEKEGCSWISIDIMLMRGFLRL